jgi:plasmid stabilization system protein ParE
MAEKKNISVEYSKQSLENAKEIVSYLQKNFSEKEVTNFYKVLADFENIIILYPTIYSESKKKKFRRAVLSKVLSVYYSVKKNKVSIIAIFDNRWDEINKINQ